MGGRVLRIITRANRGGPLRQLEALIPGLRTWGWDGPVLVGRTASHEPDGMESLREVGAQVESVPGLKRGIDPIADARALRTLLRRIDEVRPDLVHTHLGKAGFLGRFAAAWSGVPSLHTYHGHHLQAQPPADRLYRVAERWVGRLSRGAIALTPRQRRDLVQTHRVLPPRKVRVVAPGFDIAAFRRAAAEGEAVALRERLAPEGTTLFIWAGRFVPVKNPLLLLEALRDTSDRVRLVMLGDGPMWGQVRARIDAAGLRDRVFCPGPIAVGAPWIEASDAVVLSSRSEGASLLVLEGKALSKPAVVPTVGGMCDIVTHEWDGLWVPPRDPARLASAMDRLAEDRDLRARLGQGAGADAEARWGAERLARDTAAFYEDVLRR